MFQVRRCVLHSHSHVEVAEVVDLLQEVSQDDVEMGYFNQQVPIIPQVHQMMKSVIGRDLYGVAIVVKL
jgi:hypothetical protein